MDNTTQEVYDGIREIFYAAGVKFSNADLQLLINQTNTIYDRGFMYSYFDIAKWVASEPLLSATKEHGTTTVLKQLTQIKLKPRTSANTQGRNEPCKCGSGNKYKNCCAHKH